MKGKLARRGARLKDHLDLVDYVPVDRLLMLFCVRETVGLVEALGQRVIPLHPQHEARTGREPVDAGS